MLTKDEGGMMKDEIKDLFAVVNYEIEMFLGTQILRKHKVVAGVPDKTMQLFLNNALAESQVLHIRVLAEIFLADVGRKSDIKIDDLLPAWRDENKSPIKDLEDAYKNPLDLGMSPKDHIDKRIAHATPNRGGSFNWSPIIQRMNPPILHVIQALPKDHRFPSLMFLKYI